MMRSWTKRFGLDQQRGFTLVELMLVVAIIGILAAIAIPLYSNVQRRARVSQALADVRTVGSAVSVYTAHTGGIPTSGANLSAGLTTSTTVTGVAAGPFVAIMPTAPIGGTPPWVPYAYTPNVAPGGGALSGAFVFCSSGDDAFANSGGTTSCP